MPPGEREVDENGQSQERPSDPPTSQQGHERPEHDDAEADRLEHAPVPHALLGGHGTAGQHDHVEEIAGGDDADAASCVPGEPSEKALSTAVRVEGDGQGETHEKEEHGGGQEQAAVHQVVARPAHAHADPVARGMVDHHEDEGDAPHAIDEAQASPGGRRRRERAHGRARRLYWTIPRSSMKLYDHTVTL